MVMDPLFLEQLSNFSDVSLSYSFSGYGILNRFMRRFRIILYYCFDAKVDSHMIVIDMPYRTWF